MIDIARRTQVIYGKHRLLRSLLINGFESSIPCLANHIRRQQPDTIVVQRMAAQGKRLAKGWSIYSLTMQFINLLMGARNTLYVHVSLA